MPSNKTFEKLFNSLNPQQRQAVESIEGPVMVLAGPGTGKTQVVALRIAQILQNTQLTASNILALTFTEAGVVALRERLAFIIGAPAYQVTISTFHGFASRVIALFPHVFIQTQVLSQLSDADRFVILTRIIDNDNSLKLLRPIRKPDLFIGEIIKAIRTCKQENISPKQLRELAKQDSTPGEKQTKVAQQAKENQYYRLQELADIYEQYQQELTKRGYYDYEDMITYVVTALQDNADVRAYFQERYQYILVDEYQDTNNAQNTLVEVLAGFFTSPNLFVVGDDKQAIYRFQGASVANMLHFQQKYPAMKVISLTQNYRSTPEIINAASLLISHNQNQIDRFMPQIASKLISVAKAAKKPLLVALPSPIMEFEYLVTKLSELHRGNDIPWHQIAVLWRRNSDVSAFRSYCEKADLPIAGSVSTNLMAEPQIQVLIKVLEAIVNPNNDAALLSTLRLMVAPSQVTELLRVFQESKSTEYSLLSYCQGHGSQTLKNLVEKIVTWHKDAPLLPIAELLEKILQETGIVAAIQGSAKPIDGLDLLGAFYEEACSFASRNQEAILADWLEYIRLMRENNIQININRSTAQHEGVFIGTLHSAKGLEFEAVLLAGVNDRSWSSRTARQLIKLPSEIVGLKKWEDNEEEDERRLFYVGMTRAKRILICSYASESSDGRTLLPCQYVVEIDPLVDKQTVTYSSAEIAKATVRLLTPVQVTVLSASQLRFIREKINEKPFTYSDLRAYQTCPRQYLLSRILKLPVLPPFTLLYGNAVHKSLEIFFREYRSRRILPSKERLLEHFHTAVFQGVPYSLRSETFTHGSQVLSQFYDAKSQHWPIPVGVEYDFVSHHVQLGDIWISGKFDRIDPADSSGATVRVVDYKTVATAKTRNEIEGKTKNSDGSLMEQLTYYALLAQMDPMFTWKVKDFTLEFIDDKATFREEQFVIAPQETKKLSEIITETYGQILQQSDFSHTRDSFDKGCEICEAFPEF